jgi:hypothetical protein
MDPRGAAAARRDGRLAGADQDAAVEKKAGGGGGVECSFGGGREGKAVRLLVPLSGEGA